MLQGFCDSKNPKNHVVLRQIKHCFVIYINTGRVRSFTTQDEAFEWFSFASLVLPNICEVKEIHVHNLGTLEVIDWEGK